MLCSILLPTLHAIFGMDNKNMSPPPTPNHFVWVYYIKGLSPKQINELTTMYLGLI